MKSVIRSSPWDQLEVYHAGIGDTLTDAFISPPYEESIAQTDFRKVFIVLNRNLLQEILVFL